MKWKLLKECQALRMQLKQSNEENQKLKEKEKQMQVIIENLQAKLATSNLDKLSFDQAIEKKMTQILERYFTEGQIRCILQNRKYVRWSIEDYASAISFRSDSPKAYRYFQLKLNYPLPSLSSLRKWVLNTFDIREKLYPMFLQ